MLGDVDRQQSTQGWLRLRGLKALPASAPIVGWAVDPKRVLRPPPGVGLVVLDTPGGLHGFDLARVVAFADVILMPVCNSAFDRESAADCHAELMALPRVASGRCKVAAVGMRLDGRTRAAETLAAWAAEPKLPFVAALREAQVYVRGVEHGLTLFDQPPIACGPISTSGSRSSTGSSRSCAGAPAGDPPQSGGPAAASAIAAAVPSLPRLRPAHVAEPAGPSAAHRLAGWLGWLAAAAISSAHVLRTVSPRRRQCAAASSWPLGVGIA